MIHRSLSAECLLLNEEYNNLPDYIYYNITHRNNDGSEKVCTFAKSLDGKLGILPEILKELLDARNKMKKLMEEEKDYFKCKTLDGLQIAYKVTANSVYGQTGAPTSAIYCKDIAASTTATGREMLNVSRIFTEIIFKILIDSILYENFENFNKKIDILFSKKIDNLIGQKNIALLKKEKRYDYLKVFQENFDDSGTGCVMLVRNAQ